MNAERAIKLQVTHRFGAPPERVFDAFLDPAKAARFLFATATGAVVRCEIDARVGGSFVIVDRRPEGDAAHYGHYLELERPLSESTPPKAGRIVFRFTVESGGTGATCVDFNSDLVTVEIVPLDSGCEVRLTHELRPEHAPYQERAAEGWTGILNGLAAVLGEAG